MKQSSFLYAAASSTAITLATIMPAVAEEVPTPPCSDATTRPEFRLCMQRQWADVQSDVQATRIENRSTMQTLRADTKEDMQTMQEERKVSLEVELATCADLRAKVTVTDGMVATADMDAVLDCYKRIAMVKREAISEAKEVRKDVRTQVRSTRTEVQQEMKDARQSVLQSRRAAQMQFQAQFKANRGFKINTDIVAEVEEDETETEAETEVEVETN